MISICTTSIGSSLEVKLVLDYLRQRNEPGTYEYCLVHDDRYDHGDDHIYLTRLQDSYPELKLGRRGILEASFWVMQLIEFYEKNSWFTKEHRDLLKKNLFEDAAGRFLDRDKEFMWLSYGALLNMAKEMATGEVLLFCPHDHLMPFRLKWAEDFVKMQSKMSRFYYKPDAILVNVTGTDSLEIGTHISQIEYHHGIHLMTKGSFEAIGGFSEEFYWRSSGDDAMSIRGQKEPSYDGRLPGLYVFQPYPDIDILGKKRKKPRYLHDGITDQGTVIKELGSRIHSDIGAPVKFPRLSWT